MPAGEQDRCTTWTKTVHNALHALRRPNDVSSANFNEDETNAVVRKLLEEYENKLAAWRAAMVTLASVNTD